MLWYAEGPENGLGYTFWIDNVKYEKLGTIAQGSALILNGSNVTQTTFVGMETNITGVKATFNLPNGVNQNLTISPAYLNFTSSNPSVATVNSSGVINSISAGTSLITANFNGIATTGSMTVNCLGTFTGSYPN